MFYKVLREFLFVAIFFAVIICFVLVLFFYLCGIWAVIVGLLVSLISIVYGVCCFRQMKRDCLTNLNRNREEE